MLNKKINAGAGTKQENTQFIVSISSLRDSAQGFGKKLLEAYTPLESQPTNPLFTVAKNIYTAISKSSGPISGVPELGDMTEPWNNLIELEIAEYLKTPQTRQEGDIVVKGDRVRIKELYIKEVISILKQAVFYKFDEESAQGIARPTSRRATSDGYYLQNPLFGDRF